MLTLHILDKDSSLNNLTKLPNLEFVGGEDVEAIIQIIQSSKDLRYIPESGATFEIVLKKSDMSDLTIIPIYKFDPDDRSVLTFNIDSLDSLDLISQNLILKITEAGSISYAILPSGIKRTKITSGC